MESTSLNYGFYKLAELPLVSTGPEWDAIAANIQAGLVAWRKAHAVDRTRGDEAIRREQQSAARHERLCLDTPRIHEKNSRLLAEKQKLEEEKKNAVDESTRLIRENRQLLEKMRKLENEKKDATDEKTKILQENRNLLE
jgi:hypothetical protein